MYKVDYIPFCILHANGTKLITFPYASWHAEGTQLNNSFMNFTKPRVLSL